MSYQEYCVELNQVELFQVGPKTTGNVCVFIRPYQHGADMLAAISQILNECTRPDQATPAVLVLQGLHALCQAEVSFTQLKWLFALLGQCFLHFGFLVAAIGIEEYYFPFQKVNIFVFLIH